MYWKSVRAKLNSWSLVKKLMIFYTISTLGIILAIFLFLYPSINKIIHHNYSPYDVNNKHQQILYAEEKNELTIECFKMAIVALLMSAAGALIVGYVVARKGLKRLNEFAIMMQTVSGQDLDKRIDAKNWPKELNDLAITFNHMLSRIQESFVKLNQFSSDLAHELRTPLHNLQGVTEIALLKPDANNCRKTLESHLEEFRFLSSLIDNLLFIARASNGQAVLSKSTIMIKEELNKMTEYYSAMAEDKNITFSIKGEDAKLYVDLVLFKRMIINLLSNALRYTPTNGIIECEIIKESVKTITICIKDNGIGIAAEHLNKVSDRFYKADLARNHSSGGMGLGLSIVKSIMQLHNGVLFIDSQLGRGTTAKLRFNHLQ